MTIIGILAATGFALVSGIASAAPVKPDIAGLIARLGSDSFAERERASGEILALAKDSNKLERALVDAYRKSPEPEIRFRSKSILMRLYEGSVGYVGVYYQNRDIVNPKGVRLLGVGVMQVAPSSPAAEAGLQPMDIILAVNGRPLDPVEPSADFARTVQLLGFGRVATLKVLRGADEMNVKLTLAQRPVPLKEQEADALFKARIQKLEQEKAVDR